MLEDITNTQLNARRVSLITFRVKGLTVEISELNFKTEFQQTEEKFC